jgi:uncharacterized membrane protein/protein-disulfide isomerase
MAARSRALLLLTLIGLVATSWSTWVHYRLLQDATIVSACDISATVSCSDAYRSAYGTLFGVPVAIFGLCWFVGILLLQIGARGGTPAATNVESYVFALAVPALAFSAWLAYASWFVLHVLCLLCLATYIAVAGVFLVTGFATRFSMSTLFERLTRDLNALKARPAAIAVAALFLAGTVGLFGFFPKEGGAAAGPIVPTPTGTSAAGTSPSSTSAPPAEAAPAQAPDEAAVAQYLASRRKVNMMGDTGGAAVVIVKFNDYQCPPCGQTYAMYKPIKEEWEKKAPGKVKFITRDYPLEPECNAKVTQTIHPIACEAAAAVRMARAKGKADALEDWIFANQPTVTLDGLKQAVRDIGGVTDFDAQYPRVLNDVKVDSSLGGFYGVTSTPTFFVNGMHIEALRKEGMDAVIAYELKRATAAPTK